jgi:hypothetical protein
VLPRAAVTAIPETGPVLGDTDHRENEFLDDVVSLDRRERCSGRLRWSLRLGRRRSLDRRWRFRSFYGRWRFRSFYGRWRFRSFYGRWRFRSFYGRWRFRGFYGRWRFRGFYGRWRFGRVRGLGLCRKRHRGKDRDHRDGERAARIGRSAHKGAFGQFRYQLKALDSRWLIAEG